MKDPIDILGAHPSGANPRRFDSRDYSYAPEEIAQASAPFSWTEGTQPDPILQSLITIKNQGQSGSCGGQAFSYAGQRLRSIYNNDNAERSAKYPYSQVFVPGGGSSDRELAIIVKNQGFGLESDCPSYENGQPPSEAFMERPEDITSIARINAAKDQISFAYAFPTINLQSIAQAVSACYTVILGIYGSNNGTWLDISPKPPSYAPPTASNMRWAHYMAAMQPMVVGGKQGLWCPQSWGTEDVGLKGWQFIDEDYFAFGAIWGAIVLIYNSTPVKPPSYIFNNDLKLGDQNADVMALQQYLAYDGDFNLTPTGYYGPITATAVLRFQMKYGIAVTATLDELGGNVVGPATRAKLNSLL